MKRKLGKTLCSVFLSLTMIFGLIPGMSLTAKAAPAEELLTTITATGKTTYSQSVEGVVTVTLANIEAYSQQYGWLWNGTITVEPVEGYTITKCRFIQNDKTPLDDDLAPFSIVMDDNARFPCSVITSAGQISSWQMDGVTSIEVYGYVTPAASYEVTYSVVNGTWSDGTTADKTETVQSGSAPASVPSGMIAGSGFTSGSWDTDPASATITGDTTFTYTFEAIPTYTVTYSVVNGTWSDGTTANKTETVQSGSVPASIPTGMIADAGFTDGSWDTDPSSATITGNITFTYTFEAESVDPDPDTPTPDPDPVTPDPEPVTPSDTPAPVITPEQAREMTIRHFVERIYLIALNRSYDVTGRDNWVDQITDNNASGSDIARGFFGSPEFLNRDLTNEEFVTILYKVFYDSVPQTGSYTNWVDALYNDTMTRSELIDNFISSYEWASFCARYGINA